MTLKKLTERGIIGEEIVQVAKYEDVSVEFIAGGICEGTIVIPKNRKRSFSHVRGIGKGLRTKINANIGSSPYHMDIDEEVRKAKAAVVHGADTLMDLSLGKEILSIRRQILKESEVALGTVPLYQTAFELSCRKTDITDMSIKDFLATVENQAKEGVDFMTIHSGVTKQALDTLASQGRELDVVSRGGSFLISWIKKQGKQSPLYEYYDEILDILADYDVTISLGDGMRPGAVADATDRAQIAELVTLGELACRAWEKGVQVIIEGPGHVPINMIRENIRLEKSLCNKAPFYVLGPLVTDCAAGYDHIAGAIGGALAAYYGADFLCYVTPAEHLSLPRLDQVIEGVVASKIAAHAADLAKGMNYALSRDLGMARARKHLDWQEQMNLCLHSEKARAIRDSSEIGKDDVCTMCGEFCAIKRLQDVL